MAIAATSSASVMSSGRTRLTAPLIRRMRRSRESVEPGEGLVAAVIVLLSSLTLCGGLSAYVVQSRPFPAVPALQT